MWNCETNLSYITGSNRLTLSVQKPMICVIVQDAIDDIWASLLFIHAFLEGPDKVALVQGTLLAVAEKHKLGSTHIHEHLIHDREHTAQMSCLVHVVFVKFYLTETCCSHMFGSYCFKAKVSYTSAKRSLGYMAILHNIYIIIKPMHKLIT
jgi:hypothetical protein